MDSLLRHVGDNQFVVKGFVALYLISFIPAWLIVFLLGKAGMKYKKTRTAKELHSLLLLMVLEVVVLAFPYLFLLVFADFLPLWLRIVGLGILIIATLFGYKNMLRKYRDGKQG